VEVIDRCATRLHDFHIKDVTDPTPDGKATEVGRGVIDIVGVLKALLKAGFKHNVALEYEANGDAPMPGVLESCGYLRGVLDTI
jgi:sugar phosphate isomerase/epimerase